jgi:hypothetical protein
VASIIGGQFLDQAKALQTIKSAVERSWSELQSGKAFDVLDEGVTVPGTFGKTRQNEDRRVAGSTQYVVGVANAL